MAYDIERRSALGVLQAASGRRVGGYASVFSAPSKGLSFTEIVRRGAFRKTIESGADVKAYYDHEPRNVLGRTGNQTLQLAEDEHGLRFDLELPNTTLGNDVAELVRRRDITGCSFGFRVREGGDEWHEVEGRSERILSDLELIEISLVANPAYPQTSVDARSKRPMAQVRLNMALRFMETI